MDSGKDSDLGEEGVIWNNGLAVLHVEELAETFDRTISNPNYVEWEECQAVLAAAQCIVDAEGGVSESDDGLACPVVGSVDHEICAKAQKAVTKIRNDRRSELRALHSESQEEIREWFERVDSLLHRLDSM